MHTAKSYTSRSSRSIAQLVATKSAKGSPIGMFVNKRADAVKQRNIQRLADNRTHQPAATIQKKGTPILQFAGFEVERLYKAVKSNDKKKFKSLFRAAWAGMDEQISCEETFQKAREYYLNGDHSKAKRLIKTSHKTRFPTSHTGHHIKLTNGQFSRLIHPTSPSYLPYGALYTKKGNPRWLKHTSWDRARAKYVRGAGSRSKMRRRAIEFSLNSGIQPPYAGNSVTKLSLSSSRSRKAHKLREKLKRKHPKYKPGKKQLYNAPWYPDKNKRGGEPGKGFALGV